MLKPPAVILAGGRATRMGGGDKPLRLWQGQPLLAHLLADLRPQVGQIALNANGDPARFAGFDLPVVPDSIPDCGPLSGILTALDWAATLNAPEVLVVAGDTLALPQDLVSRLSPAPAYAASKQDGEWRAHPTVGLWPVALRDSLRSEIMKGKLRVMEWTRSINAREVRWDGPYFRNINRPEDLT